MNCRTEEPGRVVLARGIITEIVRMVSVVEDADLQRDRNVT